MQEGYFQVIAEPVSTWVQLNLEGCTAPMRDENQLHAAIVEIIVKDNAEVKYSSRIGAVHHSR